MDEIDSLRAAFNDAVSKLYVRLGNGLDTPRLIWKLVIATYRLTQRARGESDLPIELAQRIYDMSPGDIEFADLIVDAYARQSKDDAAGKTIGQQ